MDKNFIMNSSDWDYANLAKSAAEHGGPQKYVEAIYNDGRAADVAKARLLGVTVGAVGVIVAVIVGEVVYTMALEWLSSKRKRKNEEPIVPPIDNDENLDVETGADL